MNQQQKTYFIKRISWIKDKKTYEVREVCSPPNLRVLREQAINDGSLTIKKTKDLKEVISNAVLDEQRYIYRDSVPGHMGTIEMSELFDGIDDFTDEINSLRDAIQKKKENAIKRIESEASSVTDSIMFGIESEALDKLTEFENTNYL